MNAVIVDAKDMTDETNYYNGGDYDVNGYEKYNKYKRHQRL